MRFPGAALRVTIDALGGPVQEAESVVVTGAAAVAACGNDPDSVGLIFINMGGFDIWLALDSRASASRGIRLAANGGTLTLNVNDDFTLPTREWYAISPGGASSLYVLRLSRTSLVAA